MKKLTSPTTWPGPTSERMVESSESPLVTKRVPPMHHMSSDHPSPILKSVSDGIMCRSRRCTVTALRNWGLQDQKTQEAVIWRMYCSTAASVRMDGGICATILSVPLACFFFWKTKCARMRALRSLGSRRFLTNSSTAFMSSMMASLPILSSRPSSAASADPRIMGTSSPGNLYFDRSSRTSISTSSRSSSSSTWSTLLRKTTIAGMPTWFARSTCSRVCGMGPSDALTTRMAPSIVAAPVIMFFT
mmetsp:Transcript_9701/g.28421  ORF Transcript_9701/g.28421 Transcript_9701/m.28421 type:complete len:246 (-) Transcript_9701:404-1141(-)